MNRSFVAILTGAIVASSPGEAAMPNPFEITTDILGGDDGVGEVLLFGPTPNVRFSIDQSDVGDNTPAFRAITAAIDQTRLLTLAVDWGAAHLDADHSNIVFPICSVRFKEIAAVMSKPCPRPVENLAPGYRLLAQAIVLAENGQSADAIPLFGAAIDSNELEPAWRLNALNFRANATFNRAFALPDWSIEQDRFFMSALSDWRQVETARPSPKIRGSIANALSRLGAYDEARAMIETSDDPADPEGFQKAITTASIARLQGKPQEALEILNTMAGRINDDGGMKFHYHRGRTLMQLGRYDEAIADFTRGLQSQPDYSSAITLRGCAHAAVGEITAAREDFQTAQLKIADNALEGSASESASRVSKMIATVEGIEAANPTKPAPDVCVDYIGKLDSKRSRSPLLSP